MSLTSSVRTQSHNEQTRVTPRSRFVVPIVVLGLIAGLLSASPASAWLSGNTPPDKQITNLSSPRGIAFDAAGNMVVAVQGSGGPSLVLEYAPGWASGSPTPSRTLTEASGISSPYGVAFDSLGNMYVANNENTNPTVNVFPPNWTTGTMPIRTIAGFTGVPDNIAIDSSDNLFVSDGDSDVYVVAPGATTPTTTISPDSLIGPISGIAIDSTDQLYVASTFFGATGQIDVMPASSSGSTSPTRSITGLGVSMNMTFDSLGNLYVAEFTAVKVFAPDASGAATPEKTLTGAATALTSASWVAVDAAGNLYVSNTGVPNSPVNEYDAGGLSQTITFPALADTALPAVPPHPDATATSGLAVRYTSATPQVCTVTSAGAISFVAVGTCTINANQPGNVNWSPAPQQTRSFAVTSGALKQQMPVNHCVLAPSAAGGTIPRRGVKRLLKPGCKSTAGKWIGVTAAGRLRGDLRLYTLFCTAGKRKPVATGYGDGSRYCRKGALKIRTYGNPLRLRINWVAPATTEYSAYSLTRHYRT